MKTIMFLLICLLCFSCRNTKEIIKNNTEEKTSLEQVTTRIQDATADTKTVKAIEESISETDSTVIEETVVELSKPDSTGQQHPEKITTRVILTGRNKQTKTGTKEEIDNITENKVVETETKNEQQVIDSVIETKTTKKFPLWKIIPLVVLVAGAAFLLFKFNTIRK
jgi:hypothetical protein